MLYQSGRFVSSVFALEPPSAIHAQHHTSTRLSDGSQDGSFQVDKEGSSLDAIQAEVADGYPQRYLQHLLLFCQNRRGNPALLLL